MGALRNLSVTQQVGLLFVVLFGLLALTTAISFSRTLRESSDEQVERLGTAFMNLAAQMDVLKNEFGLDDEDLNLDLGPLGKLLPERTWA